MTWLNFLFFLLTSHTLASDTFVVSGTFEVRLENNNSTLIGDKRRSELDGM